MKPSVLPPGIMIRPGHGDAAEGRGQDTEPGSTEPHLHLIRSEVDSRVGASAH